MNGIQVCHQGLSRVYRSFTVIFHKCMNIAINVFYIFPIMLALCLMLSMTHYAGIIGGYLGLPNTYMIDLLTC